MIYKIAYSIYFILLAVTCTYAIYRFKRLDVPAKVLAILICCTFVCESVAYYLAIKYHNNLPLYAIYSLIEFGLLCLYFNKLVDVFIATNIGIYIGVIGIMFGIINLIFFQHLNSVNSYFLLFEGLAIIGMSLFAFFRMLLKDDTLHLYRYSHFWFISAIIFFWSITFLYWGLFDYLNIKLGQAAWKVSFAQLIATIITYSGICCVFLFYPKMKSSNE